MALFRILEGKLTPYSCEDFAGENYEEVLEKMLFQSSNSFNICWVGRQTPTDYNTYPDLLGIRPDGTLQVWELKRGPSPRDMIAQCLEYVAWAATLSKNEIEQMANAVHSDKADNLDDILHDAFSRDGVWDPPALNQRQELVLVAQEFDQKILDVCRWLADQGVPIICYGFTYYRNDAREEMIDFEEVSYASTVSSPRITKKRTSSRTVVHDAIPLIVPKVQELIDSGRLQRKKPFWVWQRHFLVSELVTEEGYPIAMDISFKSVVGDEKRTYVRFMLRDCPKNEWKTRSTAIEKHEVAIIRALGEIGPVVEGDRAIWNNLPVWYFAHSDDASGKLTKEQVADEAEKIVKALLGALPFSARA